MLRVIIPVLLTLTALPVSRRAERRANYALAALFVVFATAVVPIVTAYEMHEIGDVLGVIHHP